MHFKFIYCNIFSIFLCFEYGSYFGINNFAFGLVMLMAALGRIHQNNPLMGKTWLSSQEVSMNFFFFFIFFVLLFANLVGMLPFCYPLSHHPSTGLVISFTFFFSWFFFMSLMNFKELTTSLVPGMIPLGLAWALCFIESVSFAVRPFVLFIRLSSNIFSGNLIVIILLLVLGPSLVFFCSYFILFFLEVCVCIVQAFVFYVLLVMYCES